MKSPHKGHGHDEDQNARQDIRRRHRAVKQVSHRTRSIGNALVPEKRDGLALEDNNKEDADSMRQDQRCDYISEDLEAAHGEDPYVEDEDRDFGGCY